MPKSNSKRITGLDTARGIAIFLAVVSHIFQSTSAVTSLTASPVIRASLSCLLQTATPTFLFLFGFFIQIVYVKKWAIESNRAFIRKRLLTRTLQCYIALVASTMVAVAVGEMELFNALRSFLFLDVPGAFSSVLRYYIFAILLSILYIELSGRTWNVIRPFLPILILLLIWGPKPLSLIQGPNSATYEEASPFTSFIFGIPGTDLFCLNYSSTFPLLGILAGIIIQRSSNYSVDRLLLLIALMLATSLPVIFASLFYYSPRELIEGYAWTIFRREFSIMYFAIGLFLSSLLILSVHLLESSLGNSILKQIRLMGEKSLSAFAIGNSIAVLVTITPVDAHPVAMSLLAVVVFVALLNLWSKIDLKQLIPAHNKSNHDQ